MSKNCTKCGSIPDFVEKDFRKYLLKLSKVKGSGRYYRGEEYQLTTFVLYKCSECNVFFEYAHHYYSDPESTMGLARDEDDWYVLRRINNKRKEELLEKLN